MPISSHIKQLLSDTQSLFLSTLDLQGQPFASYAPYAINFKKNALYILLSDLSLHSQHLLKHPKAAILISQDESNTQQIYARKRLQYQVNSKPVDNTAEQTAAITLLQNRHGDIIDQLQQLPDFHLFKLTPIKGRYIEGFGKAYDIIPKQLCNTVTLVQP